MSFGALEHGKPYAKVNGVRADASFNVSHSGEHGLVGFAQQDEFGVDLEMRVPGRDFDGIGRIVYGPRELLALSAATGPDKVNLFYRFWSLKEALIKALGTGFSLDPSRFELPGSMIAGERSAEFRFPHLPSDPFLAGGTWESPDSPRPEHIGCRNSSGPARGQAPTRRVTSMAKGSRAGR